MIEVYASRLTDDGKEEYSTDKRYTILEWLLQNGISEDAVLENLSISIYLNGEMQSTDYWKSTEFLPTDHVEIYREPKGLEYIGLNLAILFAGKAVLSALMPKIPGLPNSNTKQGAGLDDASAKGNKVKINDVVAEIAGHNIRYPDYVVLPRRYFAGPREQRVEMHLCVGEGDYQIPLGEVKVGQTPLLSLGADASFTIYPPGADISGNPSHLYWYQAPEVGASSTGATGLDLTVGTTLTAQATAAAIQFVGTTTTIPIGSGSFPTDWTVGLMLDIAAPYPYTVADGTGDAGRDIISGDITQLGLTNGDTIEIQGDNAGFYVVHSHTSSTLQLDYDGGAPATGLVIGSVTMAIAFRGLRFRITGFSAQTLGLERIKSDGTTDTGWPGWTDRTTSLGRIVLDGSNLSGGYRGWFEACPPGELITAIEVTNLCPSGLVGLGAKGEYFPLDVNIDFEYQDLNGGPVVVTRLTHNSNSLDTVGFTDRITLPYPMRPQIREKKVFVQQGGLRPSEYHDDVQWISAYGLMPSGSKTSYAGVTTMSCNIRGGDRISSQTESLISVDCTRILPELNGVGAWGPPVPTRKISAWIGYIARNIGYADSDLDLAELQRLENIWTARGDTYDRVITDSSTVKDMMIEVLQAGFSELTLDRGRITPVRDALRGEQFGHMYNPQVMLKPLSRDFTADTPDDFDGVDVEYLDAITQAKETVQCRLPGDAGERVEKISVNGITNRNKAYQQGMRRRLSQIYRRRTYKFNTELDALNSGYLDYVALGDAVTGYGQSGFLEAFTPIGSVFLLGVSEPLDWSAGGVYKIALRRPDGSASGPYVATRIDDKRLSIPTIDFTPDMSLEQELPFYQFGPADSWCYPALITEVSPSGTKSCGVSAVEYRPEYYSYDDAPADN